MFYFLWLLALYLPFQVALNPGQGVDLASIRIFILALFLLWLAQSLKNKKIFINKNIETALVLTFLFINLFSLVIAKNQDWGFRKLFFLLSIFPVYFVASYLLNNENRAIKLTKALIFSGAAIGLVGLVQFALQFLFGLNNTYKLWAKVVTPFLGNSFSREVLMNPSWLVNIGGKTYMRAIAVFPDPHMLAFYMGMLVPLNIALIFILPGKKRFFSATLAVLLITDLLTFSRGGYVGLAVGAVFILIFFWKKINKKYKIAIVSLIGAGLLLLIFPNPVSQRAYSTFNLNEGSNQGRIQTWEEALKVIGNNPVLGVGLGNYPLAVNPLADYREPIYAHNAYFDIAAETGILNALIWIWLLMATILNLIKKSKRNLLFLGAAASLVIFATHSLVETSIYSAQVLPLLLIIMSFGNSQFAYEKKN